MWVASPALHGSDLTNDGLAATIGDGVAPAQFAEETAVWKVNWQTTRASLLAEGQGATQAVVSHTLQSRCQRLASEPG